MAGVQEDGEQIPFFNAYSGFMSDLSTYDVTADLHHHRSTYNVEKRLPLRHHQPQWASMKPSTHSTGCACSGSVMADVANNLPLYKAEVQLSRLLLTQLGNVHSVSALISGY